MVFRLFARFLLGTSPKGGPMRRPEDGFDPALTLGYLSLSLMTRTEKAVWRRKA